MRAIFGLDPVSSGQIILDGKEIHNKSTGDAIKNGIAMVNEDRRTYGLVLGRNIHENVALVNMKKYTNVLIDDKKISDDVEKMREMLQIKIANEHVEAGTLSGGNQQKVVLAKWLVGDVKVMILDEPTRGIDVGAKSEIHKLMTEFAREGMGIIMISSELPEVLGMSDRIVVMQEGIIQGILDRSEATQENIMELATKGVGDR
jgi:inositol transport system ATP-binding protein